MNKNWNNNGNNYYLEMEDGYLSYNDNQINTDNEPELAVAQYSNKEEKKDTRMAILYGAKPEDFENFKTFSEAIEYATKLVKDNDSPVRAGFWTAWDFDNDNWFSFS